MNPLMNPVMHRLRQRLSRLYSFQAEQCFDRLQFLLDRYGFTGNLGKKRNLWNERDILLITYGDMVRQGDQRPLETLREFMIDRLSGAINSVHILPFFPYSSDDGFSVIDYRKVNSQLGTWDDIQAIASHFRLGADLVLNHVSRESEWFVDYNQGIAPGRDYFIEVDPNTDLSDVVRPRSLPLLTEVQYLDETRHLWTTFSSDQLDLDFSNPDVLFEFLDTYLLYISMGARIIRLDAIAYLWKEIGTSCIHLEETHEVVKIFRDVLRLITPDVLLLTETNVPHEENISYFGDGDEAHMVYQFTLPPLLLHTLLTGSAEHLTDWADGLGEAPPGCTFLNFTASHDGVGVRPLEGILTDAERDRLVEHVKARGGHVSTKTNADGSESPYEMNITYVDALGKDGDSPERHAERFLCSQTIAMALRGMPAVYFNSLFGARNDQAGVDKTGRARSINRQKWERPELAETLDERGGFHGQVFHEYIRRLSVRTQQSPFHPNGDQSVLKIDPGVFAFTRTSPNRKKKLLCLHNVSDEKKTLAMTALCEAAGMDRLDRDVLNNESLPDESLTLEPCQCRWLTAGE
jgi:sucrose phosphorylase